MEFSQSAYGFSRCAVIAFALTCFFTGCSVTDSVNDTVSSGAPIVCLDQVVQSRYKAWEEDNAREIQSLKEISLRKDWHLLAACDRAVKEIDFHNSGCETLYKSKYRIKYAGIQNHGRIALIESKPSLSPKDSRNYVVILAGGAEKLRIELNRGKLLGNYLGGTPIFSNSEFIIYPDVSNVMLHETGSRKQRVIYEGRPDSSLLTIQSASDRYFLVMTNARREPAQSEMIILNSRFQLERIVPKVTNAMICGDRILIEQDGTIGEYNPQKNTCKPLAQGTLLAIENETSFLFADSTWQKKEDGWLKLDYSVCEYDFRKSSSREIAGKFSIDTSYGVAYPVISPDKEYVIVADNTDSALLDSAYLVYRISSGEKISAFYEPYLGKHYFTYLLAWSDNTNTLKFGELRALDME